MDTSTINKQRREIQMLVGELRDRDRELNEMTQAHQHQLQAWEQDRHRLLALEEKCHQYQGIIFMNYLDDLNIVCSVISISLYKQKYVYTDERSTPLSILSMVMEVLNDLDWLYSPHMVGNTFKLSRTDLYTQFHKLVTILLKFKEVLWLFPFH